ncbi:MAG: protein-methionine-sulfoxide reductase catalytic subunit MsrP [Alphaproteobacteria bacterium]
MQKINHLRRKLLLSAGASFAAGAYGHFHPNISAAQANDHMLQATPFEHITNYNNYYELSTDKEAPQRLAQNLTITPWQVEISGAFDKTGRFELEDVLSDLEIHQRLYRFRCVEGWSRIVPWEGIKLSALLNKYGLQNQANYIEFESLLRPAEMPGTRYPVLNWPYREGLRVDEAAHDLTLLATGIDGKPLPKQNGAPLRLVVPWKYGFKSIKAIIRISAVSKRPFTSWTDQNPREYGFFANVNPQVDHPRWSQASERIIGTGLFTKRQPTLKFNGYDQIAGLYHGMDLRRHY